MGITKTLMIEEMELEENLRWAENYGTDKAIKRAKKKLEEHNKLQVAWGIHLSKIADREKLK